MSDPLVIAADKIAERMIGTASLNLENVIEEECDALNISVEDRRSIRFATLLDEQFFCCDGCGWYCGTDELNNETDEDLCDDCSPSSDD